MTFSTGYLAQGLGSATCFVENTTAGRTRTQIGFTDIKNGYCALSRAELQPEHDRRHVTQWVLYDVATGGNLIMWWNLLNPGQSTATAVNRFRAGAFSHTF